MKRTYDEIWKELSPDYVSDYAEFDSLDDMQEYLNPRTKTYEFYNKKNELMSVRFCFEFNARCNIIAQDINTDYTIDCINIDARIINCKDILAHNIRVGSIMADTINCTSIITNQQIIANKIVYETVCCSYDNQIFCDDIVYICDPYPVKTLAAVRAKNGLSQSQLAKASGVNIKSIKAYEQGYKDIKKAQVGTILSLAKALNCQVTDIIPVQ